MSTLTIPDQHRAGLEKILLLSDAATDELIEALGRCPITGHTSELYRCVTAANLRIPDSDLNDILRTVRALYLVRAQADVSTEVFAGDVESAMRGPGQDLPQLGDQTFRKRLIRLLSINSLVEGSKALALRNDHLHTFCAAKILTDVRPVFGARPEDRPNSAVITHMLKLEYHTGGRHRELYVALDDEDIKQMMSVLKRAEIKAITLRSVLNDAHLRHVDDSEEEKPC